jgi:CRISPR-associated protein Cas2
MLVVVTYDVSTTQAEGRWRLTKIARICSDFGQRVQNSVFECRVDPAQWQDLRHRLLDVYRPQQDSLRFYFLGANWRRRIDHHGAKTAVDPDGPLIA